MATRFADLKNDFVFRRVFAHHPELTAALLNDLLDRQGDDRIVSLTLLSPEQTPVVAGAKLSILDLKARDQGGRTFVVEMQLLPLPGFVNRVVYNACKTYVGQLSAGQPYAALTDVIAVSVCDFVLWPERASSVGGGATSGEERVETSSWQVPLVSRWSMRERVTGREDLLQVQYAFVELPKVPPAGPLGSAAERWAWLFKYGVNLETMPPGLDLAQQQAMGLAEEATFTHEEAEAYRRVFDEIQQARELADEAARKGEARGEARGELRGREAALREAIMDLSEAFGLQVSEAQRAKLASLNLHDLEHLRAHLKQHRAWPA